MPPRTLRKKPRSQAGIPKERWRPSEDAKLLELVKTDITWKEIGAEVGRSEQACTKCYYSTLITKSVDDLTRTRIVRLYNQ